MQAWNRGPNMDEPRNEAIHCSECGKCIHDPVCKDKETYHIAVDTLQAMYEHGHFGVGPGFNLSLTCKNYKDESKPSPYWAPGVRFPGEDFVRPAVPYGGAGGTGRVNDFNLFDTYMRGTWADHGNVADVGATGPRGNVGDRGPETLAGTVGVVGPNTEEIVARIRQTARAGIDMAPAYTVEGPPGRLI